ncbi:hypothetical protein [Sulfuricella sp.]|uniref:hypothetical protein n=1 Tax=Sulfuricella sp. TaxID=2099377 RepID=UPI002C8CD9A0|nr:hypothetical protein [Sulfuricella sp.]HUX64485.1 hypothetical protein [Sulfuricella sp.]
MKTINTLVFATLTALALSAPYAIADDAHHPDQPKTQSATTAAPVAPASVDKSVQTMKENTKKMQTQLDKIVRAKNPQERQRLLQEHMQTMRENMMLGKGMMSDMMGCPMMEGGMMGGGMGMMGGGTAPDAATNRMNMMEKRMDMMQMMMEQMTKSQVQPKQEK